MTKMRGVDPFPKLWKRRTTLGLDDNSIDLMSLSDLVQAKKTQRDKDWPMVRRLIEVNYFENREPPTREQIRFWFLELRTPELLIELAAEQGRISLQLRRQRPLLELATSRRNHRSQMHFLKKSKGNAKLIDNIGRHSRRNSKGSDTREHRRRSVECCVSKTGRSGEMCKAFVAIRSHGFVPLCTNSAETQLASAAQRNKV